MDAVLFSIMCSCSASDLFILSSVCTEMRSIFTSKSFWKARFALLGLEHEQPSLQVYLRCLRLEDKFLDEGTGLLFYSEIDLDVLGNTNIQEIRNRLSSTRSESSLPEHTFWLNQMQSLLSSYLVIEFRQGKYNISKMKKPYLSGLSKEEALNTLLKLCPRG